MKNLFLAFLALSGMAVTAAVGTFGLAYNYTENRLEKQWEAPTPRVEVSTDAEVIERGRHLTQHVLLCAQCHGEDLGGLNPYIDATGVVLVNSPNITRGQGSVVLEYTPDDFARTIRYGVRPDGTAAAVMPVQNFTGISDDDLGAVVSYLQTVKPVDRTNPKSVFKPMGRMLWYFGVFDLQFTALLDLESPRPSETPTDEKGHGEYLFNLAGCQDCHGETASGGAMPGAPSDMAIPKNLTPHESGLAGWTRDDFDRAVRAGMSKDGTQIDKLMPWNKFAGMSPAEVDALWAHVKKLEPKAFGNR